MMRHDAFAYPALRHANALDAASMFRRAVLGIMANPRQTAGRVPAVAELIEDALAMLEAANTIRTHTQLGSRLP